MNEEILQQIFAEILSELEPLETRSSALLQFLKSKGIATDEELAHFLDQAGNASSVRSVALRVRLEALISSALKPSREQAETTSEETGTDEAKNRDRAQNKAVARSEDAARSKAGVETKAEAEDQKTDQNDQLIQRQEHLPEDEKEPHSRETASSKKNDAPPPRDTHSEGDLRDSKLSNPPLLPDAMGQNKAQSNAPAEANTPHDSASSEPRSSATEPKAQPKTEAA